MSEFRLSRRIAWVLAISLSLAGAGSVSASDEGQAAADQVSLASYQGFMNNSLYTHTGDNRGPSGAQHNLARDNIYNLFASYGLTTTLDAFSYSGTHHNVVGELTGTLYPNSIYIIGGHYDSVSNPGADDNASGVALVLEAARILSQYPSDYTIRFMAFDMEEVGLVGSEHYASTHASEDIRGMISLDMVCFDPNDSDHALIYGRTTSNPIKNALAAAASEYGGLTCTDDGQLDQSDHASFEAEGFQACLLIEGDVWDNPYYHTQNDKYESVGYLNWTYAVKMTKSVVGWLVDTAGVDVPVDTLDFTYPYGLPESSPPPGGNIVRVEVAGVGSAVPQSGTGVLHYNTGAGWQTSPLTAVSQNVYNAVLPAATCGTEILYYISAQDTGGQTYVDPHGAPVSAYTTLASYGVNVVYENVFDSNPGWTAGTGWAFGHPTGGGSYNHDPTNGHTGTNVYGYNLAGDYGSGINPARYLTTPAFNCTGQQYVQMEFWRWLGVESNSSYDEATVEASNNGTTWTVIWRATSTGAAVSDAAWTEQVFDVSAIADNRATFYVRWGMGPTDSYVTYPGWNLDDFALSSVQCASPWSVGDLNCDGSVRFGDINPFVLTLTDPVAWQVANPGCPLANGDINGDGAVTFRDINPFVALLSGGGK